MGEPTIINIIVTMTEYIGCGGETEGTETSKYLKEQKTKWFPK